MLNPQKRIFFVPSLTADMKRHRHFQEMFKIDLFFCFFIAEASFSLKCFGFFFSGMSHGIAKQDDNKRENWIDVNFIKQIKFLIKSVLG